MPIHVRAEPGDYAEACLLPGDPLRAKYIAETYFDDPVERNTERGMLGYTGTYEGAPVSVQATGMGCPSAAIVMEELAQLGVKRFLRVGTCGGLQYDLQLGDLIVAVSAVPADGTARHYVGGEPHTPTADWELVHAAVHSRISVGVVVVGDERAGVLRVDDHFHPRDVLSVVENDLDLLDAVVILHELVCFLLRVGFEGFGDVHVTGGNGD